ncbi:MAG: hypothetical protein KJ065_02865 [Anaerolineae bacterium]|nr:hypothetical protein [Anaerolineae bacterium]
MVNRWQTSLLLIVCLSALPFVSSAQVDDPTDLTGVEVIVNPEIPFLLIYAEPDDTAPASEAVSGGVALILTGATETVDSLIWRQVTPPSSTMGWVLEIVESTPTLLLADGTPLRTSDEPRSGETGEPVRTVRATYPIDGTAVVAVDLLLIYDEPDTESSVVEAVVRDVALEVLTVPVSGADVNWTSVRSPSGIEGWVQTSVDGVPTFISDAAASGELAVGIEALVGGVSVLLLIREEADANAQVIEAALSGVSLLIIGGPTLVDDVPWWQVRSTSGIEGWVPEVLNGQTILLSPDALLTPTLTPSPIVAPTATPAATATIPDCAGAPPAIIAVGGRAMITPGTTPNRFRRVPGLSGQVIGHIESGEQFSVIGGPECADSHRWWQVDFEGNVGWTADGEGDQYWIVPIEPSS